MNVVLTIDGRKAIPVRALPFVAGRRRDGISHLSPDEVAGVAAHQDTFHRVEPFATFHIVDGVPRPVAFSQWGQFVIRLKALSGSLEAEERNYDESYAKWTDESIPLLPAAVFVWLDEFQAWFSRTRPLDVEHIQSQDDDGEVEFRHEGGDLYFSPLVPQRLCPCIHEGFEELFNAPAPFESLTEALEGWFDKPKAALPAWQKYRVDIDFGRMPWDEPSEEQRRARAEEWDAEHDPKNAAECEATFYEFDEAAALAGLTALEAARLLLTRDGELLRRLGIPCFEEDAPPLARKLLTLEEMRASGVESTVHPLAEWLRRAKEKGIEYLPGLDWAVEHCSHSDAARVPIEPEPPLSNEKPTQESPPERRARLAKRANELGGTKRPGVLDRLAAEEGCSRSNIKRLLQECKAAQSADWQSIGAQARALQGKKSG